MNLREYLQSEHAKRAVDLARRDGRSTRHVLSTSERGVLSVKLSHDTKDPPGTALNDKREWIRLSLTMNSGDGCEETLIEQLSVSYWPEADYYIVSDRGESMAALRHQCELKPGDSFNETQMAAITEAAGYPFSGVRGPTDIEIEAVTAQLPTAICQMLLASHRVAALARDERFEQSSKK